MITVRTNIAPVVLRIKTRLTALADKEKMLKACAVGVLPAIKDRIHVQGKASDGNQIGVYSEGYMKVRTGNFGNSKKFSKGKNKGKLKDAGSFTKGNSTGAFRPKYNRSNDTKVIASLTRQLENDYITEPTDNGYGIGFSNPFNREKSDHVETTYKKKIWDTTSEENQIIKDIAIDFIENDRS